MKKLGKCFKCRRIMSVKVLRQIEYFEGHLGKGCYHHKIICLSCLGGAEELADSMEKKKR